MGKIDRTGQLLKITEVAALTSLSTSEIYARIARGEFPAPLKIGQRRVAWLQVEVRAWIDEQPRAEIGG